MEDISWHDEAESEELSEIEDEQDSPDFSDIPGDNLAKDGKKFDCQRQKLLFTYPSHIPKKKLYEFFCTVSNIKPAFWRAAHETGTKKVQYPHTHVLLNWGTEYHFRNCRKFDWVYADKGSWKGKPKDGTFLEGGRTMHPNIKAIGKRRDDWTKVCDYIAKDDIDNADLKSAPSIVTGIQSCKTLGAALTTYCKTPGDAMGIGYLFNHKEKEESSRPPVQPVGWQADYEAYLKTITVTVPTFQMPPDRIAGHFKTVTDNDGKSRRVWIKAQNSGKRVNIKADDRQIGVIHDPRGNSGKSKWARSLCRREPGKWLYLPGLGDERDIANIIRNAINRGWSGHGLFIDMARTHADYKSTYSTIERVREGCINATKYDSDILEWDSTIVVMLTNWMPDLHKLSVDRWEIFTIDHGEECGQFGDLMFVPLHEAFSIYDSELKTRKKTEHEKNSIGSNPIDL